MLSYLTNQLKASVVVHIQNVPMYKTHFIKKHLPPFKMSLEKNVRKKHPFDKTTLKKTSSYDLSPSQIVLSLKKKLRPQNLPSLNLFLLRNCFRKKKNVPCDPDTEPGDGAGAEARRSAWY